MVSFAQLVFFGFVGSAFAQLQNAKQLGLNSALSACPQRNSCSPQDCARTTGLNFGGRSVDENCTPPGGGLPSARIITSDVNEQSNRCGIDAALIIQQEYNRAFDEGVNACKVPSIPIDCKGRCSCPFFPLIEDRNEKLLQSCIQASESGIAGMFGIRCPTFDANTQFGCTYANFANAQIPDFTTNCVYAKDNGRLLSNNRLCLPSAFDEIQGRTNNPFDDVIDCAVSAIGLGNRAAGRAAGAFQDFVNGFTQLISPGSPRGDCGNVLRAIGCIFTNCG